MLFAFSFLSGVITALRRLRSEIDLIHTHQALWEAVGTGLARPLLHRMQTLVQASWTISNYTEIPSNQVTLP